MAEPDHRAKDMPSKHTTRIGAVLGLGKGCVQSRPFTHLLRDLRRFCLESLGMVSLLFLYDSYVATTHHGLPVMGTRRASRRRIVSILRLAHEPPALKIKSIAMTLCEIVLHNVCFCETARWP